MSARLVALSAVAAAILIAGLYLLHVVHEAPAAAGAVTARHDSPAQNDQPAPPPPPLNDDAADGRRPIHHVAPPSATHAEAQPALASDADPPAADDIDYDFGTGSGANPKLDSIMALANKAYDRQDYEEAKTIAGKVLAKQPKNTRMARIMVSASCFDGDAAVAQRWYEELPKGDREMMAIRCKRNGITFTDPAN